MFVSLTAGVGIAIPAAQANGDAADFVTAVGIADGTWLGIAVATGTSVGSICFGVSNWLRKRKKPTTAMTRTIPATANPVFVRDGCVEVLYKPERRPVFVVDVKLPSLPKATKFNAFAKSMAVE